MLLGHWFKGLGIFFTGNPQLSKVSARKLAPLFTADLDLTARF